MAPHNVTRSLEYILISYQSRLDIVAMPPEAVEEVSALDGSERAAGNAARRARAWICHARGEFDFIRRSILCE